MTNVEVIVVGGGASGLMAAITAASQGKKVLLLEKMKQIGKKILMTGNGKCNYTNKIQNRSCYASDTPQIAEEILQQFTAQETIQLFQTWGIWPMEKNGYVYPATGQASSMLHILERQLDQYHVEVCTAARVKSIRVLTEESSSLDKTYEVISDIGNFATRHLIIATGGMAAPKSGSSGDAYYWLENMGCLCKKPVPALTSCVLKGDFMKKWAGVRTQGSVQAYSSNQQIMAEDTGELQFVDYGISGIPMFQISRYISRAIEQGDAPYVCLDLLPDMEEGEVQTELERRKEIDPKENGVMALDGMLHEKLTDALLYACGISSETKIASWSSSDIQKITARVKHWKLGVSRVSDFEKSQVTSGGILLSEIHPQTMEIKKYPGLCITGEMLDVDGICGGYNLQWAWTTGYLAGKSAASVKS